MGTEKDIEKLTTYDFSETEQAIIDGYVAQDCPTYKGIRKDKKDKWYRLYRTGKTYGDIASITNSRLDVILYASLDLKWTEKRDLYYSDLANSALSHVKNIRSQSVKTMSTIVSAFSLYFEEKFGKYISTKDDTLIENMDVKILAQYYKSLEVMSKMFGVSADPKNGLNININNSTPKKTINIQDEDKDVVDIDFNNVDSGDVLKELAKKGMD